MSLLQLFNSHSILTVLMKSEEHMFLKLDLFFWTRILGI